MHSENCAYLSAEKALIVLILVVSAENGFQSIRQSACVCGKNKMKRFGMVPRTTPVTEFSKGPDTRNLKSK